MVCKGKKLNKRPTKQGGKGKVKKVIKLKPIANSLKPRGGIGKEDTFFHCGKTRH